MKQNKKVVGILLVILAAIAFTACNSQPVAWETDFEVASEAAKSQNKGIFLIFTGTSWDGVTATLKTNVIDTEKFMKTVGKNYILCNIDIAGEEDTDIPEEVLMKHYQLAMNFNIQSIPTALLLTKAGTPFAQVDFSAETLTPEDGITLVTAFDDTFKKLTKLQKAVDSAKGTKKVKAIDNLFEATDNNYRMNLEEYILQVPELDPENTTGLLGKYQLTGAYISSNVAFAMGDAQGAINCFLSLAGEENTALDANQIQEAYYVAAYISAQSGASSIEEVVALLTKAYDAAPTSEGATGIQQTITALTASETEVTE